MRTWIEIPVILIMLAMTLESPVNTNLVLYRTCYIILGYNQTECALLGTSSTDNATNILEEKVQVYASVVMVVDFLTAVSISSILCFFLGAWSDKYGRRPIMLATLAGQAMGYAVKYGISCFPNLSPWYLMVGSLLSCFCGGFISFISVVFSYITDLTIEENRGARMATLEAVMTAGILIGTLSCSYILAYLGYSGVFLVASGLALLAWLFTYFLLTESVQGLETDGKLRNVFRLSNLTDIAACMFKSRSDGKQKLLIVTMTFMVVFIMAVNAGGNVLFLYVRKSFNWSLHDYTVFLSESSIAWILGSLVGGYLLNKLLHVGESLIIIMGCLCLFVGHVLQGLATKNWQMYLAGGIRFGGAISPLGRSIISKTVEAEETGKVFSLLSALEGLAVLPGPPIFTYIYDSTLHTNPGFFNYAIASFYAVEIVLMMYIMILQYQQHRRSVAYSAINSEATTR